MKKIFIILTCGLAIALAIALGCNPNANKIENVLQQAGSNRTELEKVLAHYRELGDKQKLRAAEFLIANMDESKFCYDGDIIGCYDTLFAVQKAQRQNGNLASDPPAVLQTWNYLQQTCGPIYPDELNVRRDNAHLTADFLIGNIDNAFAAWKQSPAYDPNKFDLFCEYLLPYRVLQEPVEEFRTHLAQEMRPVLDSALSVKYLIKRLNKDLFWDRQYRASLMMWGFPIDLPLSKLEQGRRGSCRHLNMLATLILRAVGYPAAINRTVWANRSTGHLWTVVFADGGIYPFDALTDTIDMAYKPAKIFQIKYSSNENALSDVSREDVPNSLITRNEVDVTSQYVPAFTIKVPIQMPQKDFSSKKHGVICAFDNKDWRAVYYGKISGSKMAFEQMAANSTYMAAYYHQGEVIFASQPFTLLPDGSLRWYKANKDSLMAVRLERKYPRFKRMEDFAYGLRRADFEASNNPNFTPCKKFYSLYDLPFNFVDRRVARNDEKYRYLRFKIADIREGNIAELEFYGKKSKNAPEEKLTGQIIGYPAIVPDDNHPYTMAMDGNLETWFAKKKKTEGWVGIDLGKGNERIVTRARFAPRSDTNFILKGDTYELMYWDNGAWHSLGRKVAEQYNFIDYNNVPSGTLYLLHDHTRGVEERIFTYEDGKQVWW